MRGFHLRAPVWASVDLEFDCPQVLGGVGVQGCTFREVLPQQTVGITSPDHQLLRAWRESTPPKRGQFSGDADNATCAVGTLT